MLIKMIVENLRSHAEQVVICAADPLRQNSPPPPSPTPLHLPLERVGNGRADERSMPFFYALEVRAFDNTLSTLIHYSPLLFLSSTRFILFYIFPIFNSLDLTNTISSSPIHLAVATP